MKCEISSGLRDVYYDFLILRPYSNKCFFENLYQAALSNEDLLRELPIILPSFSAFWREGNQIIIRNIHRIGIDWKT